MIRLMNIIIEIMFRVKYKMKKILVLLDKHLSNFEIDGQQCLLTCH